MKILAAISNKFKGDIKVQADRPDIKMSEDGSQISITKSFVITGVDLSGEVSKKILEKEDSEDWVWEVEQELDWFLKQLKRDFTKFEKELSSYKNYLEKDGNLLGFNAEVSLGSFEKKADLEKMRVDIELSAFYDIPKSSLELVMDEVVETLTDVDSKKFNSR